MSMHRVPLTPTEEAGMHAHGLQRNIGKPSQLADVFRQGVAWGAKAERERAIAVVQKWRDAYPSEDGTRDALGELQA